MAVLAFASPTESHGGLHGYVTDPDDHASEIAWNLGFARDDDGNVTFGL